MWAVVLVVRLADLALQASPDLGTHANTVPNLDRSYFVTDLDRLAHNLVADAEGKCGDLAPTSGDGVDVATTDTAALDFNVNVAVFEFLWFDLWQWLLVKC